MSDLDVRIRESLDDLVRFEAPSPLLRERTLSKVRRKQRARPLLRAIPAVAAAAILALFVALVLRDPDGSDVDVTTETTEAVDGTSTTTIGPNPGIGGDEEGLPDLSVPSDELRTTPGGDVPLPGSDGPVPNPGGGPAPTAPQNPSVPTTPTTISCDGPCEGSIAGSSITPPAGPIAVGSSAPFTITARSSGSHTVLSARIEFEFVLTGSLTANTPAGCSNSVIPRGEFMWVQISCPLGDLAPGAQATRTFDVGIADARNGTWVAKIVAANAAPIEDTGVIPFA
jgi:hypothetical protein